MIIVLATLLTITIIILMVALIHIGKIIKELNHLAEEQHTQNIDILDLRKYREDSSKILLQQNQVLQYFADQDPTLSRKVEPTYYGVKGDA